MNIDSSRGTYAVIMVLNQDFIIQVGTLGLVGFTPGYYVYSGSAFGPGGLRARVGRHLSSPPKLHWHIDYLRQKAAVVEVWFTCDLSRREHDWASILGGLPGVTVPFPGFGSSDCQCLSHLFRFGAQPRFKEFHTRLLEHEPGHETVHRYFTDFKNIHRSRSGN